MDEQTRATTNYNQWQDDIKDPNDSDSEHDEQDLVFQDLELFLHAIGEAQLVECFKRNKITLGQLLEFNEQDLINCGIDLVGDRKKILENTGQMHCEKWAPSSLQDMTAKSLLSSPGYYIALNDINKHIEYIGVTLKYLRRRVEENPELLELGKDFVGVAKIASELDDMLKTTKTTYAHLRGLNREINRHFKDPLKKPANLIDQDYVYRFNVKQKLVAIGLVSIATVVCSSLAATLRWRF